MIVFQEHELYERGIRRVTFVVFNKVSNFSMVILRQIFIFFLIVLFSFSQKQTIDSGYIVSIILFMKQYPLVSLSNEWNHIALK
jgi:hypothetical protein